MSKKPYNVTNVVVSAYVASSNPILPIIELRPVIEGGKGILTEAIFGGQVTIHLDLEAGNLVGGAKLADGELVYVHGERGGLPFTLSQALTTDHDAKPWKFSRVSGSTG